MGPKRWSKTCRIRASFHAPQRATTTKSSTGKGCTIRGTSGAAADFNPWWVLGIGLLALAIFAPRVLKLLLSTEDFRRGLLILIVLFLVPTVLGTKSEQHDWTWLWLYLLGASPLAVGLGLSPAGC